MKLLLDTNLLARLCHPTAHRDVQRWFQSLLERGPAAPELLISVLADYELRRTLMGRKATASLEQLDRIAGAARYLNVTAEVARRAAELRTKLQQELGTQLSDADLMMVAQAQLENATLVTSDRALSSLSNIDANDWDAVTLDA